MTYVDKIKGVNFEVVCPDSLRKILTGSESDMSRDDFVWQKLIPERIKLAMADKKDIIFDSTAINKRRRREIIKYLGVNHKYKVESHYFEPNLDKCLKQNRMRERFVPEKVIEGFCKKWEVPTLDEGFSLILNLTSGEKFERV